MPFGLEALERAAAAARSEERRRGGRRSASAPPPSTGDDDDDDDYPLSDDDEYAYDDHEDDLMEEDDGEDDEEEEELEDAEEDDEDEDEDDEGEGEGEGEGEDEDAEQNGDYWSDDPDVLRAMIDELKTKVVSLQQSIRAKHTRTDHFRPRRRPDGSEPSEAQLQKAAQKHEERAARFFRKELKKRKLCRAGIVNRLGLDLNLEELEKMRGLGFLETERFLAVRECRR